MRFAAAHIGNGSCNEINADMTLDAQSIAWNSL